MQATLTEATAELEKLGGAEIEQQVKDASERKSVAEKALADYKSRFPLLLLPPPPPHGRAGLVAGAGRRRTRPGT